MIDFAAIRYHYDVSQFSGKINNLICRGGGRDLSTGPPLLLLLQTQRPRGRRIVQTISISTAPLRRYEVFYIPTKKQFKGVTFSLKLSGQLRHDDWKRHNGGVAPLSYSFPPPFSSSTCTRFSTSFTLTASPSSLNASFVWSTIAFFEGLWARDGETSVIIRVTGNCSCC